jgi:hypothetical protein
MSMFDYYRPTGEQRCPVCLRVLREWQGKDGPNGLFLWAEGTAFPVDQMVDEEVRVDRETRICVRLPQCFTIYSYDCPDHQPVDAECHAPDGVWIKTVVQPFKRASKG